MPEAAFASTAHAQNVEQRFDNLFDAMARGELDPPKAGAAPTPAPAPDPAPQAVAPEPAPEPQAAAPETEPDYVNVEDYLQKAGIERDSFYQLPVRVKVDGKESDVPFSEVLKSYQLEKHVQQKSIAFAEQQKAWEAERAQAKSQMDQQLQLAQNLGNLAHKQLLQEFQSIDWNKLRMEDPVTWSVRNTEFRQRADAIQQHLFQVEQQRQQQAQAAEQELASRLPKERERMLDARPEWRDEKVFSSAKAEMATYAQKLGYTTAELQGIYDYRQMLALHDAARFAQLQAQAPQAVKRVRAAPQQATPGARITRDPKQVANQQAKERFQKNPRSQEAQRAYFDTLAD